MTTQQIAAIAAARREAIAGPRPNAGLCPDPLPTFGLRADYRPAEALTEKYRPQWLAEIVGQGGAVAVLRSFVRNPYPTAFLFAGASGCGKTSAALALANELGCATERQEFGGLWQIASGEQTVANVRELLGRLAFVPFYGSGWRCCIVNEADQISAQAEAVWLDALENLPPRTVVIFTTNNAAKLSDRFRDRCQVLQFDSAPSPAIREAVVAPGTANL